MIIAVDIGGTKTLVASFHGERSVSNEERFPTPHDPHEFLEQLHAVLKRFDAAHAQAICVAAPGIIDADGTILRCSNLPWTNFELQKQLSTEYACPIFINNDAKLAGLAETHSLDEVPPLSVYVTVSTGIGTGIITHGKIDSALATSEGGYMMLQTPEGFKPWEKFASGHAIRDHFGKMAADIHDPAEWHEVVERLALGLQVLIPLLQPQVIIVGGSVGTYFDRFGHLLTEVLRSRLPTYIDLPRIVQAQHPQEAVVYGCYYYATHQGITITA
jgi:predicted NBD/HSP70 family sugar kinase